MKRTIKGYHLGHVGLNKINMYKGANLLDSQYQGSSLYLWAEVDEDEELTLRHIYVLSTGKPLPPGMSTYVGTAIAGSTAFHIYDAGEE